MITPDAIGWAATAVFTASYLTRGQTRLRRVQMAGATLWLTYGLVLQAPPVIGSNILVLSAACWAEYRQRRDAAGQSSGAPLRGVGHDRRRWTTRRAVPTESMTP